MKKPTPPPDDPARRHETGEFGETDPGEIARKRLEALRSVLKKKEEPRHGEKDQEGRG